MDVIFLLDTSGSIEQIYQEHVKWTVSLVDALPVDRDGVRIAAIQYAGFPLTEFALGTYLNADDIRQHLSQIKFQSGVTRTGYALRKADSELFRQERGARYSTFSTASLKHSCCCPIAWHEIIRKLARVKPLLSVYFVEAFCRCRQLIRFPQHCDITPLITLRT